ncbi:MAG: leucine-rich repeat domain-containing protein [Fibromonadaceae bacterium]|nr:leucine-rich repeat domain-containing protein [Fibromonadaceae bacterium]
MKSLSILQAIALTGVLAISHASENWTGDGGKGTSITIDAPKASGLAENQGHLPTVVQAELVSNFSSYSAISVLDWEHLGEIYAKLGSGVFGGDSTEAAMQDLGQLATTTYFMTGSIAKAGTSYHLQVNIIKTADKMTAASYSGTFSYWDLDNRTGIRKASLELLKKMGVTLTAKAQGELAGAATASQISGQTAFAKGITAQRRGNEVEALSYYFQAATFDPSLKEAVSRSSTLNANIASGSMGNNVRNDIQWRKQWVDRLTETEQFFDNFHKMESMPYTLFYSKDINQGKINYQNETVELSIETYLYGSEIWTVSIERALQAVYDGLNATKRKEDWGLDRWPQRGVTDLNAFERRSNNFSVVFELVNNQNKVIGSQALQAGGSWGLNWSGRPRVEMSRADRKTLNFQNVNANDITDNMTIRVASVNDVDAETAAIDGVLQIKAITKSEANWYDFFRFSRGEVQGFANRHAGKMKKLVIPNTIWGDPVTSIGKEAFDNALIEVVIPNSVSYIGEKAFSEHSNKSQYSFDLSRITIGANVDMAANSFRRSWRYPYESGGFAEGSEDSFQSFYSKNGKKAGIYIDKRGWNYLENQEEKEKWDEETIRTAWMFGFGGMLAAGVVFDMKNISPYLNSTQGLWPAMDFEFYKRNLKFFRFGFNFGIGSVGIDEDAVKKDNPNVKLDSTSFASFHVNAFARLYPVDFLYLSGGVGWYSSGSRYEKTNNNREVGVSTAVFPVGGGICLGSFRNDEFMGIFIEGLYNIVPSKGGYISIKIGTKMNFRITKTKEEEEAEEAERMRMRRR